MAYFKSNPTLIYLVFCTFKEWCKAFVAAFPFVLILLGFEWLFTLGAHLVLPLWGQFLYLLAGGMVYGIAIYAGVFSVHCRLLGDEVPFIEVCQRLKKRFMPMFTALFICTFLVCVVLALMLMLFASYSVTHAFHGFLRKPIITALLLGGVVMVVAYVFFMWVPFILITTRSTFQSLFRSVTLATGKSWRHAAIAFGVFVTLGLLLFGGNKISHIMAAYHLTILYNAICYATVGVWLSAYIALLADAHQEDELYE